MWTHQEAQVLDPRCVNPQQICWISGPEIGGVPACMQGLRCFLRGQKPRRFQKCCQVFHVPSNVRVERAARGRSSAPRA